MDPASGARDAIAASLQRTWTGEARRNELTIAWVRVLGLLGMLGMEIWLFTSDTLLAPWRVPLVTLTLVAFGWAVGVGLYLRSGRWWGGLPWVCIAGDAAYLGLRQGAVLWALGADHFVRSQDLATVVGVAALLMVTGAFRLQTAVTGFSLALGVAIYLGFSLATGLHPFFICVHALLLGTVGLAAAGLTRIVDRAVRSELTRATVARLLPDTVLEAASTDPLALLAEPRAVQATVLITDLRGFTRWAERRDPLEVLGRLNAIQGALAEVVQRHGGAVDKFMGDGMLAVFGAVRPLPDHAQRAVRATAELLAVTERIGEIAVGVGVHSGELVVGCLGAGARMEFTVIGDTVNLASRLESATKELGVPVLISGATAALAPDLPLQPAGRIEVRGRQAQVDVFTLPDAG